MLDFFVGCRHRLLLPDFTQTLQLFIHNEHINLLNPTGHLMHQQFNIQQLYALPTLYFRVLYVFIWEQTATCAIYTAWTDWFL